MTVFKATVALFLYICTATNGALGDMGSDQLISRHIEWRGGIEALENIESVKKSGRISIAGLNGSIVLSQRKDGYLYQMFDLDIFKGTEVMTPEDNWVINTSGQLEDMGITSQQSHRRTLLNTFTTILRGETDLDYNLLPPEERDGQQYSVIRYIYDNGDYFDMFIDPVSGAHSWTRSVTDRKTVWHKLSDWRMLGNVRYPFHEETLHEHEAENSDTIWQTISINSSPDLSLYARPKSSQDTGDIEGDSSTGWLPIQLFLDRYIYVRGRVNGYESDIVLDSGAGITVLDKRFSESAGIKGQGALQAHGVSGSMVASMVDGISIDIGNLHLQNITAAILDLSEISKGMDKDIPVILGKEVFNNFIVDIDYLGKRIAFHKYEGYYYRGKGKALKLFPGDDGHKHVDVVIESLPPARVSLDTGSGQTLTLFKAYWDDSHQLLDDGRNISDTLSGGVGGDSISVLSSLKSIKIAGFELSDVPAEFYNDTVGSFNTKRLDGNLGAGILKRFRVIFDYQQDRLILEPSAAAEEPFSRNRVGLQLKMKEKKLTVIHVAKGSPAEKAGWRKGDILVAANNELFNDSYREWWNDLSTADSGTVLSLTNAKGITTSIVLADYY